VLTTLDHLIVAVNDLERATDCYARLLGRKSWWGGPHPGRGTRNSLFRLDNTYLELIAPDTDASNSDGADWLRARLEDAGEGLVGMAFGTEDAEACASQFRERGLHATDPVPGSGRDERSGALREWRTVHLPGSDTRGVLMFAIEHRAPAEELVAEPEAAAGVVSGLDHVVVNTADADGAIELYGHALGIRLALDRTFEKRGVRLLFFRIGGTTVELAARAGGAAAAQSDPVSDRLWGLAYKVADVDAARTRIAAAGFDVTSVRSGNKSGTRVCSVRADTHGVPTLLIEPAAV